jgi:hypothetical protein
MYQFLDLEVIDARFAARNIGFFSEFNVSWLDPEFLEVLRISVDLGNLVGGSNVPFMRKASEKSERRVKPFRRALRAGGHGVPVVCQRVAAGVVA